MCDTLENSPMCNAIKKTPTEPLTISPLTATIPNPNFPLFKSAIYSGSIYSKTPAPPTEQYDSAPPVLTPSTPTGDSPCAADSDGADEEESRLEMDVDDEEDGGGSESVSDTREPMENNSGSGDAASGSAERWVEVRQLGNAVEFHGFIAMSELVLEQRHEAAEGVKLVYGCKLKQLGEACKYQICGLLQSVTSVVSVYWNGLEHTHSTNGPPTAPIGHSMTVTPSFTRTQTRRGYPKELKALVYESLQMGLKQSQIIELIRQRKLEMPRKSQLSNLIQYIRRKQPTPSDPHSWNWLTRDKTSEVTPQARAAPLTVTPPSAKLSDTDETGSGSMKRGFPAAVKAVVRSGVENGLKPKDIVEEIRKSGLPVPRKTQLNNLICYTKRKCLTQGYMAATATQVMRETAPMSKPTADLTSEQIKSILLSQIQNTPVAAPIDERSKLLGQFSDFGPLAAPSQSIGLMATAQPIETPLDLCTKSEGEQAPQADIVGNNGAAVVQLMQQMQLIQAASALNPQVASLFAQQQQSTAFTTLLQLLSANMQQQVQVPPQIRETVPPMQTNLSNLLMSTAAGETRRRTIAQIFDDENAAAAASSAVGESCATAANGAEPNELFSASIVDKLSRDEPSAEAEDLRIEARSKRKSFCPRRIEAAQ